MQHHHFLSEQLGSQLGVIDQRKGSAGLMTKETGNGHGVDLT